MPDIHEFQLLKVIPRCLLEFWEILIWILLSVILWTNQSINQWSVKIYKKSFLDAVLMFILTSNIMLNCYSTHNPSFKHPTITQLKAWQEDATLRATPLKAPETLCRRILLKLWLLVMCRARRWTMEKLILSLYVCLDTCLTMKTCTATNQPQLAP